MRLYLYEHCPYCIRVVMGARMKGWTLDLVHVPYDDAETPRRLIGSKMLPILQDGAEVMSESLDILQKLDEMGGERLFRQPPRPQIVDWITAWKSTIYGLVLPRAADPRYPEFQTPAARAAFVAAKEARHGPMAALRLQTDRLVEDLQHGFETLVPILPDGDGPPLDDILLFPMLRTLAVVREPCIAPKIQRYCERVMQRTGLDWPKAV